MVRPRPGSSTGAVVSSANSLGDAFSFVEQPLVQRPQVPGGAADPVGQRRAIEIDALAGVDLGLPIQRQVIGIFGHQHLGDGRLGRQAALDQPRRRRRLHDTILAGPAGVFGPARDEHPELRRHDVEPLAHVLADPVQLALAAGAGLVVDVDDDLDPRQMRRQRAAVGPALRGPRALARPEPTVSLLASSLAADLLDVFEAEQQLIFGQRLGPAAEAMPLQFLDDLAQPLVLAPLGEQHRLQRLGIVGQVRRSA